MITDEKTVINRLLALWPTKFQNESGYQALSWLTDRAVLAGGSMVYGVGTTTDVETVDDLDFFVLQPSLVGPWPAPETDERRFWQAEQKAYHRQKIQQLIDYLYQLFSDFQIKTYVPVKDPVDLDEQEFISTSVITLEICERFKKMGNYFLIDFRFPILKPKKLKIQLIMSPKKTPESVLASFDLDYVQVGLYQHQVYFSPEAIRAHESRTIYSFRPTKAIRFMKAQRKGFRLLGAGDYGQLSPFPKDNTKKENQRQWVALRNKKEADKKIRWSYFKNRYGLFGQGPMINIENLVLSEVQIDFSAPTRYFQEMTAESSTSQLVLTDLNNPEHQLKVPRIVIEAQLTKSYSMRKKYNELDDGWIEGKISYQLSFPWNHIFESIELSPEMRGPDTDRTCWLQLRVPKMIYDPVTKPPRVQVAYLEKWGPAEKNPYIPVNPNPKLIKIRKMNSLSPVREIPGLPMKLDFIEWSYLIQQLVLDYYWLAYEAEVEQQS